MKNILYTLLVITTISILQSQEFGVVITKGKTYKGELLALDSTGIKLKIEYGQLEIPASDILNVQFPSFFNRVDSNSNEITRATDSFLKLIESLSGCESKILHSLQLNKNLPDTENCFNSDFIGFIKIDIEKQKDLVPFDEPYPIELWIKVVDNLFIAGATYIIFNSDIPNITKWYKNLEKQYPNIYRTINKDSSNSFSVDFCPDKVDNNFYTDHSTISLPYIIDTEKIDLKDPIEDVDWMSQFLPFETPEWIMAIEDPADREATIEALGIGGKFDVTQTPFYKNIILIGF